METPAWMAKLTHRTVKTNGIDLHFVEQGTGPTVLLLHGFPEIWYTWRYQIPALAEAGYHVVAPDLRGCGESKGPSDAGLYTTLHVVGDLIGLLNELKEECVFVVGHDWGAVIAWDLCLFRPDRVKAVVCMSVPFMPRTSSGGGLESLVKDFGEGVYIARFQEPGRAERDFQRTGTRESLEKILYAGFREILCAPEGKELMETAPTPQQPSWISDFDIQYHAEQMEKSGWTGGLNYYRCLAKSHELKGPWTNAGVKSDALYIVGDRDAGLQVPGIQEFVDNHFKEFVPNLKGVEYVEGGHFIQQEKPSCITDLLLAFFAAHSWSSPPP